MMSILSNTTEDSMAKPALKAGPRQVPPLHPGSILAGILKDVNVSVRAAAARMGVSHNALANILKGDTAVSAEMAVRIGALCGNGPELWMNLQRDYDLWQARAAIGHEAEKIEQLPAGG
jgi:addiction module HigA family antidote